MTIWTEQESAECIQMVERGEPLSVIAWAFKRTTKAVSSRIKRIRSSGRLTRLHPGFTWTADQTEQCLEIWERGASFSIIAQEMGKSRSAVAGHLARLGKRRPASIERLPPYRGGGFPKRIAGSPKPKPMPKIHTSMYERVRASKVKFDPVRPVATLDDRLTDGCTWPFGEEPPYTYCNQQCVKGLSFCPTHCRLAYNNMGGV